MMSGDSLFLSLPEDVLAVIARFVSPRDLCNLILCCKSICDVVDSENIWLAQCEAVKILPLWEIVYWRTEISSYKALCRFLVDVVKPLVGIWVHQSPEVGNVVYVRPCFLSVVGCRIVPQDIDPSGIQEGRFKWSPVFEIVCGFDGSAKFFLHGKDVKRNCCSLYPGFVTGIEKSCNLLLLEVEPRQENEFCSEIESNEARIPFQNLSFNHRRELLDKVTSTVCLPVPSKNMMMLERRSMHLKMHKFGGDWNHMNLEDECTNIPNQVDISHLWKHLGFDSDFCNWDTGNQNTERKSLSRYFRSGIKHILGRFTCSKNTYSSRSEYNRHVNLHRFLSNGDSVGLSLKASNTKLSFYQGWPNMNQSRYALYKLPIRKPVASQEYAGLWGGTFGWPPGKCSEDKPVKPLFLLKLSYEESQDDGERLLIGTKLLESAHYAKYRNGCAMFVVKIASPSFEMFPLDTNGEDFEHSYAGEGVAQDSSFRSLTYEPGSLFVTSKGLIMFVWKATRVVLTLQRVNLGELFRKGMCMRSLPPCVHFAFAFAPDRRRY